MSTIEEQIFHIKVLLILYIALFALTAYYFHTQLRPVQSFMSNFEIIEDEETQE